MAIPASTYDIATISNPSAALTDFTLIVDLSNMSTAWWAAVNTTDGTKGRASKSDGVTELACDFIDFNSTLETGILRVKYTGTLASTGTQQIRVYPPNTANTSYLETDTYGQYNAYDSNWIGYWQDGGINNRIDGTTGTGFGSISSGDSIGKVGSGTSYDGTTQYIDTNTLNIAGDTTNILWANADISSSVTSIMIGETARVSFRSEAYNNTGNVGFSIGAVADYNSGIATPAGMAFYSVSAEYANQATYNINGTTGSHAIGTPTLSSGDYYLGAKSSSGDKFKGILNEVQSHALRSNEWILEEYAQSNDNATFWGTWTNVPVGGTSYTLIAEPGTLAITGQTASLKLDRNLTAEAGNISITGNDAALTINRVLKANPGSLTITGQDANLVYGKGYILSADAGSITITGQPVTLTKTNILTAESGSLNISGKNVTLTYSGAISAYYEILNMNGALISKTTLDASLITIKSINGQAISIEEIEGELL